MNKIFFSPSKLLIVFALALAFLVLTPLSSITLIAYPSDWLASQQHWQHLGRFILIPALIQTAQLLIGVAIFTLIIGLGSSFLISNFDFPGRQILAWGLILPLAMPTYIAAYIFVDLWHPIGPIQSLIRSFLGYSTAREWRLGDARGMFAAIIVFSLVLYPYIYLSTRVFFQQQSASLIESAKSLGLNSWQIFFQVTLKLLRPALTAGIILILLETLNDIGASEILGINTLMLAVHNTWVSKADLIGAAQISLSCLLIVFSLLALEWYSQRKRKINQNFRPIARKKLHGKIGLLVMLVCFLPVFFGFVMPVSYLVYKFINSMPLINMLAERSSATANFILTLQSLQHSLTLSFWVSCLTLFGGLILAFVLRHFDKIRLPSNKDKFIHKVLSLASIGYAIPGTLLALGFFSPLAKLPNSFALGSIFALVIVLVTRFMLLTKGQIYSSLRRIPPNIDQAAKSLDANYWRVFFRIHFPLIAPAMIAGWLMVFIDTMKELPATLMLRPLNWETLATQIYADAARGNYEDGALASLCLITFGLIPVIILARDQGRRNINKNRKH